MIDGAPMVGTGQLGPGTYLIQKELTQLAWITVRTDGSNAVTVELFDGLDAVTGTKEDEVYAAGADNWVGRDYPHYFVNTGLCLRISGTNARVYCGYGQTNVPVMSQK